ncbi:U6 small nuclear RNA (adenine-(43)-N(6))-methyltransferase [Galendromus occidentalis]|uniref:U6 small nuclear RNA (adenine-(43)-N(6))-methyltransferase n=1 Tax=Galendromus occidentalis TaxID=34638 RepID=A0AAJ7P9L3_9ACAR|nr:U6 small nuclear RNA (adenine-(43)-N(6))-methyltransferase [Galendromus occidentalis]
MSSPNSKKKRPVQINFNDFMHHRNIYFRNKPEFSKLALEYPEFREISVVNLNGEITLDFTNPEATRVLSRCLLKSDFDLDVEIPRGYLAPAVPQRLNYLLWCEDIVNFALGKSESVVAVDFGTGSSCILPFLGVKQCSWRFLGVEANPLAFEVAAQNVTRNGLGDYIKVVKTSEGGIVFQEFLQSTDQNFDILLCNPPFYKDSWEANAALKAEDQGRADPNGDCMGEEHEKVTPGGELEFVRRVVEQSLIHKDRIRVASAMLGKKKDLKELSRFFRDEKIRFTTTEFCQGKTMRWGIAWTHDDGVDLESVPQMKHVVPKPPLVYQVPSFVPGVKYSTETVCTRVKELLLNVQIMFSTVTEGKNNCHLRVLAQHNTLTGQRRRRRERDRKKPVETVVPAAPQQLIDEAAKFSGLAIDRRESKEEMECGSSSQAQGSKRSRSSSEESDVDSPMDCRSAEQTPSDSVKTVSNKRVFHRPEPVARFLDCDLRVRRSSSGLIIQLQNRDPSASRDSLCQLQQYLKNNLCSQPKDLALTMKMLV